MVVGLMQHQHKLNGFPYKEFERIGLDSQQLYRIKRKNQTIKDKEILKIAFNQKYGELGTVEEKLFHYYVSKAIKIKYLPRSEEHTSELQSRGQLVCRLLLEKKK